MKITVFHFVRYIVLNQDESDFSIGISDVGDAGGIAALDEQGNVVANNIPAAPNDDGKYNLPRVLHSRRVC